MVQYDTIYIKNNNKKHVFCIAEQINTKKYRVWEVDFENEQIMWHWSFAKA